MEVSMVPQAMALTEIPLGATSLASAFVKELTAPLLAEYATSQEAPTFPQTEEMLRIRPDFLCSISGRAYLQQEKTEERLVFITCCHCS